MNNRNMLKDADDSVTFMRLSESEIADDIKSEMMYFDGISEYRNCAPTDEEIKTTERVIKYASQCNYMGFTCADARLVMSCTTNVLKWALEHRDHDGDE